MVAEQLKSVGGASRIAKACGYSMRGIAAAWRHEASFRQEVVAGIVLVPLAIILPDRLTQTLILCAALLLVLMTELLNSALESLCDAVSTELDPRLGRVKDMGSAAVMTSILIAMAVWGAVLL